ERAVAVEYKAFVEVWLTVRSRRIHIDAKGLAAGEQRGLPAVTPEAFELANALALDAQDLPLECAPLAVDLKKAPRPAQLLIARAEEATLFSPHERPRLG